MPNDMPWVGAPPTPETPVTLTLPARTMKAVLTAITNAAHRAARREDERVTRELSKASEAIGDLIGAPKHKRFIMPNKKYHAVIAADEADYERWLDANRSRTEADDPFFIDSVETAQERVYSSYAVTAAARALPDLQAIIAAVHSRTFVRR